MDKSIQIERFVELREIAESLLRGESMLLRQKPKTVSPEQTRKIQNALHDLIHTHDPIKQIAKRYGINSHFVQQMSADIFGRYRRPKPSPAQQPKESALSAKRIDRIMEQVEPAISKTAERIWKDRKIQFIYPTRRDVADFLRKRVRHNLQRYDDAKMKTKGTPAEKQMAFARFHVKLATGQITTRARRRKSLSMDTAAGEALADLAIRTHVHQRRQTAGKQLPSIEDAHELLRGLKRPLAAHEQALVLARLAGMNNNDIRQVLDVRRQAIQYRFRRLNRKLPMRLI
jgi:DNA-directed RNA polymerase specialized sigma24 family protein